MNKVVELVRRARDQVRKQDELGSVIRAGAVTLAIRVAAAGATYLSVVALARWMGALEFGIYTFAWAWTVLLAISAGLGLPGANVRFVPNFVASNDWARIRGIVRTSWALTGSAGLAIAAVGILTVLLLRQYVAPHHVVPLLIALAGIPFVSLVTLQSETARGFGWMAVAYAPSLLAVPLLVMAIAFGVLQFAGTLRATNVVVAAIAAYFLVLLYQTSVLRYRLAPKTRHVAPCYERRHWLKVAVPILLINVFAIVHFQSDVIMVGLFLDPQEVAFYSAAARTAFLTTFLLQAGNALGAPKYALLYSQGRTGELQALLSSLIHWMFWPSFLAVLAMIVLGESILGLFGPLFSAGYWPLVTPYPNVVDPPKTNMLRSADRGGHGA